MLLRKNSPSILFKHSPVIHSSILNYLQSLPVIASENEEEFDSSISSVVVGVQKSYNLVILEEISYFRSNPFTLIYL